MWSWNDLKKAEAEKVRESGIFHQDLLSRKSIHNGRLDVSEPGHHPLTVNALKGHLNGGSFTIMTAENPGAKKLTPFQNQLRNNQLEQKLKQSGAIYHKIKGKYGNEENSYMIHHTEKVGPEHLERLGSEFGQESVLHSSQGKHQLKYVSGENAGKHHPGEGITFNEHADNYYSQLPNRPESKFTANVDFSQISKSEGVPTDTLRFEIESHDGKKHSVHFHIRRGDLN